MTSVNSVFVNYVLLGTRAVNCKFIFRMVCAIQWMY